MTPDHGSPQCCIPGSIVLVKLPNAASDPNPDIQEFPVKLNPKFSDPDTFTRIGFSSVHIFFLAAAQDIQYKKRRDLLSLLILFISAPYLARMKRNRMRL